MTDGITRAPARRSTRRGLLAAVAFPTVVALGLGLTPGVIAAPAPGSPGIGGEGSDPSRFADLLAPGAAPHEVLRAAEVEIPGLPQGVSIDRVEWLTSHRVAVFIRSAAMPEHPIQVQILLARDWYVNPEATFPEVWALDGMRARTDNNGWTEQTNIEQLYADKNVNVVLPVGGASSFYADWQQPDNGTHYMWETFLIDELIPVLTHGFRSNGTRAIVGLSMGGTAAINLAARNPGVFSFAGSFSGYLDTSTEGMPSAIAAAQRDAGGFNATAMWGPLGSAGWKEHDPKLLVDRLRGTRVYVSAGTGREAEGVTTAPDPGTLISGMGLEAISRLTTQTFLDAATKAGVDVSAHFRDSGIHTWYYWQFEMAQAWPAIAEALGIDRNARQACEPIGAIAAVVQDGSYGNCLHNEYAIGAEGTGRAQEFTDGTVFWSPATGAHGLRGRIGGRYAALGGPASWLGFPTSEEIATPDGAGRYQVFEHGTIHWHPLTGAQPVPVDFLEPWGALGWEQGRMGFPLSAPVRGPEGVVQQFVGGYIARPEGQSAYPVYGAIADKYRELGLVAAKLGAPTSAEQAVPGGAFQSFEHGLLYWSSETGTHVVYRGDIFDAWRDRGFEQGELGWPIEDHAEIPAGGEIATFQHGTISQINGVVKEERK